MAEKITFKDMLAALPQQQDADSVVARDANGNPIYISKADLAQVAAELMPTASPDKKGLMPQSVSKFFRWLKPNITTTNVAKYVSIKASGKYSFLLANIRNTSNASIYLIGIDVNNKYSIMKIAGKDDAFYLSDKCLIVYNYATWSEYAIIPLTGDVDEVKVLDSLPQNSTELAIL